MSYQETLVDVIDTNLTKKPNSPQFKFKNPLTEKIYVNSIQLSFDAYFSEKGAILIKINNNPVLNKIAGSLKRLQNFTVPMKNQEFLQQQKIEIYAWNGVDSDFVSVGYDIQISEDPNAPIASDTPLSQSVRNQAISEAEILFSKLVYYNETVTKLLDMKGYKKLIINMSAQDYPSPTVINNPRPFGTEDNAVDGDLASQSGFTFPVNQEPTDFTDNFKVEFADNSPKIPVCKFRVQRQVTLDGTCTVTVKVFYSEDNIIWTQIGVDYVQVTTQGGGAKDNTVTRTGTLVNFKYIRIEYVHSCTTISVLGTNAIFEMYDAQQLGGTASLSFDELDIADNTFSELIASSEFGTVTVGTAIKVQVGDTANISNSGKTYFLPSTQTGLRAKLVITGGGISTAVSIRRIT